MDPTQEKVNEPLVVCANESELNHQQASLKTLIGDYARKPPFLLRTIVIVLVLRAPRVLPPAIQKNARFR